MNDDPLIAKILARDKYALAQFYKTYASKLAKHIARKVGSAHDAEEILQDTLYAFLEAARDFHGTSSVKTFLFSICEHKIIDYYRKKKLKHIVFSQIPGLEAFVSPVLNPEEALDSTLYKEKIYGVFGRLIPRYRHVLVLKYLENMSVDEIAQKLALTVKSVESRLFRARKAFVKAFISI